MRLDLTGHRFGRLVVLARAGRDRHGSMRWRCKCDCGREITVRGQNLRSGNTRSCGCYQRKVARIVGRRLRPQRRRDLTGQQVGDLFVLHPGPNVPMRSGWPPQGHTSWICRCVCGRVVQLLTTRLTHRKPITSCGCRFLRPEVTAPASDERSPESTSRKTTTGRQWLERQHEEMSPLGKVRRIFEPVEPDGDGRALCDFDPYKE